MTPRGSLLPRPFVDSAGHRWFATYPFRSPQRLDEEEQTTADQLFRAVSDLLDQVRAITPAGG